MRPVFIEVTCHERKLLLNVAQIESIEARLEAVGGSKQLRPEGSWIRFTGGEDRSARVKESPAELRMLILGESAPPFPGHSKTVAEIDRQVRDLTRRRLTILCQLARIGHDSLIDDGDNADLGADALQWAEQEAAR